MVCRSLSAFADAPRAGSAEAKHLHMITDGIPASMHSVQAAPRQSVCVATVTTAVLDALRAGSAEAKQRTDCASVYTGDAPRAGSAEAKLIHPHSVGSAFDAPRAGSAEAKQNASLTTGAPSRCTPCRQRRGKVRGFYKQPGGLSMHPVQAAPRQRTPARRSSGRSRDAPRAGSAKQNNNVPPDGPLTTGRHFFTFHPSRIPTVGRLSSVTMYNPAHIFLTDPAWRSRIFPTVSMLSVTGRPRGYEVSGGSPWG